MDDISIFADKDHQPGTEDLQQALGGNFIYWDRIQKMVMAQYPKGVAEWNYPGKKYGWSYRIKDKKRAIIYFLPRDGYFKVAFLFGQKAYAEIQSSTISSAIKTELQNARVYAEGRGVRIDITNETLFGDIEQLIQIKLNY